MCKPPFRLCVSPFSVVCKPPFRLCVSPFSVVCKPLFGCQIPEKADIEMLTSRVEVVRDHLTGLISTSLGELNKGELLAMVRLLAE